MISVKDRDPYKLILERPLGEYMDVLERIYIYSEDTRMILERIGRQGRMIMYRLVYVIYLNI